MAGGQERFVQLMVLDFGGTEEVLQELRDTRDLDNDTLGVPKIDLTLHDWEATPVLADAPVLTIGQSEDGRKGLLARQ